MEEGPADPPTMGSPGKTIYGLADVYWVSEVSKSHILFRPNEQSAHIQNKNTCFVSVCSRTH